MLLKIIHKAVEATGELNSYGDKIVKKKPVEEIIILPGKREEISLELIQVV